MTFSSGIKRTIHQSLIRPVLFGGAERGVSVLSVSAAIGIPMFAGLHVLTVAIAFVFALPMHALGVWLARRDPQMIAVYLRSLSASDHYVPWAGRCPRSAVVHPCIPGA
ncbi:MAG: VirB3 family type IV secretion system protein [Longimicrobiales bacterium]